MQSILEQNLGLQRVDVRSGYLRRERIGIFAKLFGCRHRRLTRPFTNNNSSYRACLGCGARREFDTKSFKTLGAFYYPHSVAFDRN